MNGLLKKRLWRKLYCCGMCFHSKEILSTRNNNYSVCGLTIRCAEERFRTIVCLVEKITHNQGNNFSKVKTNHVKSSTCETLSFGHKHMWTNFLFLFCFDKNNKWFYKNKFWHWSIYRLKLLYKAILILIRSMKFEYFEKLNLANSVKQRILFQTLYK